MPCIAVKCPCRLGDELPLDHWDVACPLPPMQRGWYRRILWDTLNDKVHVAGNVTITRLLNCPRKAIIADYLPYALDPAAHHAMYLGTVVHREAQVGLPSSYRAEVEVRGKLFGLEVSGRIDCLGNSVINEVKFHRYVGMRWKRDNQKLVDGDNVAQVSMQRLLLAQQTGAAPTYMLLSHSSDSEPGWPTEPLPMRDERWIGEHQPLNGSFRVKDIAGFFSNFKADLRANGDPVAAMERCVPFVGKAMMPRKKDGKFQACAQYCIYREKCPGWVWDASQA